MIKLTIITFFSIFFTVFGYSQNDEFNTSDLRRIASLVGFEGVKLMKKYPTKEAQLMMYSLFESDRAAMRQLNINSWGVCERYNIDNFDIYNYYYKKITRDKYNLYCKELNALMLLDGTIDQLR